MKVEVLRKHWSEIRTSHVWTCERVSQCSFGNRCDTFAPVLGRDATKGQAFWFFLESLCQIGGLSRRSAQLSPLHGVGYLGSHYHNHRQLKSFFHASIKTHQLDWVIYITPHSSITFGISSFLSHTFTCLPQVSRAHPRDIHSDLSLRYVRYKRGFPVYSIWIPAALNAQVVTAG